nr:hypothetical protein [Bradyrhizobium nanningense]
MSIGQDHDDPIDTKSRTAGLGHTVFYGTQKILVRSLRLFTRQILMFEPLALLDRMIQLAIGVANLHADHERLDALDQPGMGLVTFGQRADLRGMIDDEDGSEMSGSISFSNGSMRASPQVQFWTSGSIRGGSRFASDQTPPKTPCCFGPGFDANQGCRNELGGCRLNAPRIEAGVRDLACRLTPGLDWSRVPAPMRSLEGRRRFKSFPSSSRRRIPEACRCTEDPAFFPGLKQRIEIPGEPRTVTVTNPPSDEDVPDFVA